MDPARTGPLWDDTLPPGTRRSRAPLPGPRAADVVVVGGGLTGLWTAYYLSLADPGRSVVVLERDHVGYGASGRNGGWCSALMPVSLTELERRHGHGATMRMQRTMYATVDEVLEVCAAEGIDARAVKGGSVDLARTEAQVERAQRTLAAARSFGIDEDDLRWLSPDEARGVCGATDVSGALFTPHCAALDPARLVHGIADRVEARGVVIHERTAVHRIGRGHVDTEHGRVTGGVIVRATEGYTPRFRGARREVVPLYSMMIATEPLSDDVWRSVGLEGRPTFADGRRSVIYGQRTADGRLAFGGRGAPYHFASRVEPRFDTDRRVRDALTATLHELLPATRDAAITHHWGGPLGVPRDFHPTIRFDRRTGFASAGGYVGDGLTTTNVAGRTLADLIVGSDTELTRLPWVGHRSRRWEPEPLRWLGVNGVRLAAEAADRAEREGTRSMMGTVVGALMRR